MKKSPSLVRFAPCLLVFAASLVVVTSVGAQTQDYVSVNFVGGNANGAPTSMLSTDIAGVGAWALPNWNNAANNTGTLYNLADHNNALTDVSISYSNAGTWGSNTGTGSGDAKMLNGYIDGTDGGTSTITFSGLVPDSSVSVVGYHLPDGLDGRTSSYWVATDPTQPTYYLVSADGAGFPGYVQVTNTTLITPDSNGHAPTPYPSGSVGNYTEWDNITVSASGTVTLNGYGAFRNYWNGIQLEFTPPATGPTTLTWNGGNGTIAPADGGGTWDNGISSNWWSAASSGSTTWSDSSAAVFGAGSGSAGTVNISGTVRPGSLAFQPSGDGSTYTLSGGTIDLNGAARVINCAVNATIASTPGPARTLGSFGRIERLAL